MKLVIFTDLDASLLDPVTYSWEAAREALEALKSFQASVVLASSKTFAEMAPLHSELGLIDPFVVENGGGIALKAESTFAVKLLKRGGLPELSEQGEYLLIPLGTEYPELVAMLGEISSELDLQVVGFSSMSAETISGLTGLTLEQAVNAKKRLFDEPFLLPINSSGRESRLPEAAAKRNLTAVEGGRFWHLIGHPGKGRAISLLIDSYRSLFGEIRTIGLGDSPNDLPFLELVDTAIFLGDRTAFHGLCQKLGNVRMASISGPRGWNQEILYLLEELKLSFTLKGGTK